MGAHLYMHMKHAQIIGMHNNNTVVQTNVHYVITMYAYCEMIVSKLFA